LYEYLIAEQTHLIFAQSLQNSTICSWLSDIGHGTDKTSKLECVHVDWMAVCCVFCLNFGTTSAGSTEYDQLYCTVRGRRKQSKATWLINSVTLNQTLLRYQQHQLRLCTNDDIDDDDDASTSLNQMTAILRLTTD